MGKWQNMKFHGKIEDFLNDDHGLALTFFIASSNLFSGICEWEMLKC